MKERRPATMAKCLGAAVADHDGRGWGSPGRYSRVDVVEACTTFPSAFTIEPSAAFALFRTTQTLTRRAE